MSGVRGRFGVAAALFAVALAARLPFGTEHLWGWDSVLYARAMAEFDASAQRPHPPGYLAYVLLARAVDFATNDPNSAMVLISAVAGAAAVALLYALGARLYDERTGRLAALFLLTAVSFWAYGAVAYPYTLLAALSVALALLCWRALETRRTGALLLASASWGVAAGFRPDLHPFIAPLWLLAGALRPPIVALVAASFVAAPAGAWLLLTAEESGGLDAFLASVRAQSEYVARTSAVSGRGPAAIFANGYDLARFVARGLYALALPLLAFALVAPSALRRPAERAPLIFLTLWIATPLAVYLLVHVGDYGYIFSFLPALALLAARGTLSLVRVAAPRGLTLRRFALALVLTNAAIFLWTDTPLSATDLARRDRGIAEKVAHVRTLASPELVIVSVYDAVLVEHYLPGVTYRLLRRDPFEPPRDEELAGCAASCAIVAWDDLLVVEGDGWESVPLPSGARLRIARLAHEAVVSTKGLTVHLAPTDAELARRGLPPRRPRR